MIEELKLVLDMLGDVTGIAAWVLVGFVLYKAIIYLSTAGMIYHLVSMLINKVHNAYTNRHKNVSTDITSFIEGVTIKDVSGADVVALLRRARDHDNVMSNSSLTFIHRSHLEFINDAIDTAIKADQEKD